MPTVRTEAEKAKPDKKSSETPRNRKLKKRKPTGPKNARLMIDARGAAKGLTREAIGALKKMGYWDDLTKNIYAIRISSRGGALSVREDGRLADSLWTYYRDDKTGELGDLCDLLFFTQAIEDDVARQAVYYAQGRLDHPAPTLPEFWAVLLAHEVAHCSTRGQRGEAYSTRWETKVLAGFGIDRVGSP